MNDLISRDAAIEAERQKIKASDHISRADAINAVLDLCKKCDSCYCGDCLVYAPNTNIYDVIDLLTDLPSAEKVGKWIEHEWAEEYDGKLISNYECSECKSWERERTNYCPNCGARMDAEREKK